MSFDRDFNEPKDRYFASEDTIFVSGDSPATHDVNASLGVNSIDGYIKCDGAGDILITLSSNGSDYGSNIRLKQDEEFDLSGLSTDSIKITHSGADSSYRIFAR